MVMMCLPVSLYICINSFCMCIVFSRVAMSFSGLHSITNILVCDIIRGGGINLGSLAWMGARCVRMIFYSSCVDVLYSIILVI